MSTLKSHIEEGRIASVYGSARSFALVHRVRATGHQQVKHQSLKGAGPLDSGDDHHHPFVHTQPMDTDTSRKLDHRKNHTSGAVRCPRRFTMTVCTALTTRS